MGDGNGSYAVVTLITAEDDAIHAAAERLRLPGA
jgi:hypothetical protein